MAVDAVARADLEMGVAAGTELPLLPPLLEKSDDEITQAYIYKTTGIPKATLSEIMGRLERRNIIKRRKEGRIKWIRLKQWIFK